MYIIYLFIREPYNYYIEYLREGFIFLINKKERVRKIHAKKTYVVGISGGSCSGKTTISNRLEKILSEKYKVSVLHLDWYYKKQEVMTIAPITRIEYAEHNHPDVMDIDRIYNDFTAAIADETNDVVLIEGLFALYFDQIREKLDLKVFIDLKSDERIYRRIKRWIDRQTIDEIALRYLDTVRYRHDEFIEPTRWHADLVVNGTLDANLGTDIIVSYIEAQL